MSFLRHPSRRKPSCKLSSYHIKLSVFDLRMCKLICISYRKWLQVDLDTANKQYEKAYKLEQEFGEYFTGTHCYFCLLFPVVVERNTWMGCVVCDIDIVLCWCTATVSGDTADEVYSRCKEVIYQQSSSSIWIPSKDKL